MVDEAQDVLRRFASPSVRRSDAMDTLGRDAVFGDQGTRERARWLIWEIGQQAGARPASIHELYLARGRGKVSAFTTPAINVRMLGYDTARAIFRAAVRMDVGAVICEIGAQRNRLHRAAPRRVRGGDHRGGAPRGLRLPGVHPGRSRPGQREEVRDRPRGRAVGHQGVGGRGAPRGVLQHRCRHVDAGRSLPVHPR